MTFLMSALGPGLRRNVDELSEISYNLVFFWSAPLPHPSSLTTLLEKVLKISHSVPDSVQIDAFDKVLQIQLTRPDGGPRHVSKAHLAQGRGPLGHSLGQDFQIVHE